MEFQSKVTSDKNEPNNKKLWQTPIIEIISRDSVQSGVVAGIEGVYIPKSSAYGNGQS